MRIPRLMLVMGALTLAACGSDTGTDNPAASTDDEVSAEGQDVPVVEGSTAFTAASGMLEWRLVSIGDTAVPDDINATIRFNGDEFSGEAPCNRYFGSRNTDPDITNLFSQVGATRMMCPDAQMVLEDKYFRALGAVTDIRIEDDQLILTAPSGEGASELRFDPQSPVP